MKRAPIEALRNYETASRLEWIESDGVGGIAASSCIGANTRKQHALLALELDLVGRCVLVSNMQETVFDGEASFELSTNAYSRAIHPTGFLNLVDFSPEPWPTWRFQLGGITLERQFFLAHGEHTAVLIYTVVNGKRPLRLVARPMLAFRSQNMVRRAHDWNPGNWQVSREFTEFRPLDDFPAVYIAHPNAVTHTVPLWYYDFLYERDRESNVDCIEDLFSPGYFEIELAPGQPRALVISTPSPRSTNLAEYYLSEERTRRSGLRTCATGRGPAFESLARCADLLVHENREGDPSILAGLPWGEADYPSGLLAMPGLLLSTQRFELARDYLRSAIAAWVDSWNPSAFQSVIAPNPVALVDGPLWIFVAAWQYWIATGDREFLANELYPKLETVASGFMERLGYQCSIEPLISVRRSDQQEIVHLTTNALWYNALETLAQWASALKHGGHADWRNRSELCRRGFQRIFLCGDGATLANVVSESGGWRDASLRSSQVLAIGLPFAVLIDADSVLSRFQAELATPVGLRSLSCRDSAYVGDGSDIRFLPRRWSGSVDPAYSGLYCDSLIRAGKKQAAHELVESLRSVVSGRGDGFLPGAFSGDAPHGPCDFVVSACAVGEALRVFVQFNEAASK
ncbi:MAG: glycogen debranching enzyme family protein [Candidatus Hydrogenedentes bacterium]|nr:glycogen debranching enzyme family protein [Candidatus Hydrogenedentota bacterium]